MLRRREVLTGLAGASAIGLGVFAPNEKEERHKMQEIKFDLGKNILETAKTSGVPTFSTDNIEGYISYSVAAVPAEIPARYTRAGYEIVWQPIFSLTMRADERRFADKRVQSVALQFDGTINTHEQAQAFVEQTLAQFQKGKWQRYHDPVWETLLTGRSSLLDETGKLAHMTMTIDPAYKIPSIDWPEVVAKSPNWRWLGDGVLATLEVRNFGDLEQGLDYRLNLEFDLLEVKLARDAENEARRLKEGDAKGWNSTARHEADKNKAAARIKRLEANAIQRGDSVVKRP